MEYEERLKVVPSEVARAKMREIREGKGLTIEEMAKKARTSAFLVSLMEDSPSDITHRNIAERIGKAYGLGKKYYLTMMHRKYWGGRLLGRGIHKLQGARGARTPCR